MATQRRDVVLSAAEEASEWEKTALSSLQSISTSILLFLMRILLVYGVELIIFRRCPQRVR